MVPMEGMTAEALDRVVPDRPVCLHDDNVHAQWVNSELLRRAGVGREDPGWAGAVVERLPDGSPKGLLHEAFPWVDRALPQYTVEQRCEALRHFQRELAARYGTTLVHEAGLHPWETMLDAYLRLEEGDELTARFCLDVDARPRPAAGRAAGGGGGDAGPLHGPAGPRRRRQALRRRRDRDAHRATSPSRTPTARASAARPIWAPERLVEASVAAAAAGFQLHYHAIGDAAVSLAVDAIAAAAAGRRGPAGPSGAAPARDIVTHVQLVDAADYARMAALGVDRRRAAVLVHQGPGLRPGASPAAWAERAARQYPMREPAARRRRGRRRQRLPGLAAAGPAARHPARRAAPRPAAAVENTELWPEEAVDVETMIAAFTIAGARANFLEHETGSLEPGKSADLVVLSEDILELPPERIHEAEVRLTLFRGAPVFARRPSSQGLRLSSAARRVALAGRRRALDQRDGDDAARLAGGSPRTRSMSSRAASRPCSSGVVVERRHRRRARGAEAEVARCRRP